MPISPIVLTDDDRRVIISASRHLEHPSFAARLSNVVGTPIEMASQLLPNAWYRAIRRCAEQGIGQALDLAVTHVKTHSGDPSHDRRYKLFGLMTGAIGGFFGGPALLLELPLTTTLMLGTIADIAQSEGEDLDRLETRLACLEVFALGGRSDLDDAAETGYYGLRLALELPIANATRFLQTSALGAAQAESPVLIGLITRIAERFGIVLSEKALAELLPLVGALGGAFINSVFFQHFQDMARAHFSIRRLERAYGPERIRAYYESLGERRSAIAPPLPKESMLVTA